MTAYIAKKTIQYVTIAAAVSVISGCTRTVGPLEASSLPPQPTGNVASQTLSPIAANSQPISATTQPLGQAQQNQQQLASTSTNTSIAANSASINTDPIERGSVAGVWDVQVQGGSCKLATSFTRRSAHYQASALRCPNTELSSVREWNVSGNQLVLYDSAGSPIVRMFKTADQRFDGKTSSGVPVTFSRT